MKRIDVKAPTELSPALSANVLFHFMTEMRFLKTALETKALFPRYCKEDIGYLGLEVEDAPLINVAYPEKCFCDMPVHEVYRHSHTYGQFGIGLKKSWGMANGIQPIQYFNVAFQNALSLDEDSDNVQTISDFLVSYMLYIKPLTGRNWNRVTGQMEEKFLTDECEWRFIPDLSGKEMEPVLLGNDIYKKDEHSQSILEKYNNALEKLDEVWLKFDYSDVKYITVSNHIERDALIRFIQSLTNGISDFEKLQLISKIIVFEDAEEDF
jgi:hypothetical protein